MLMTIIAIIYIILFAIVPSTAMKQTDVCRQPARAALLTLADPCLLIYILQTAHHHPRAAMDQGVPLARV
jgi:hypothetical protein